MISIELKLVPMWPDHAPAIMYRVLILASAANAAARAAGSAFAPMTPREFGDGHVTEL
jgi:hypothetical protein